MLYELKIFKITASILLFLIAITIICVACNKEEKDEVPEITACLEWKYKGKTYLYPKEWADKSPYSEGNLWMSSWEYEFHYKLKNGCLIHVSFLRARSSGIMAPD